MLWARLIKVNDRQVTVKEGYLYWTGMESDSRTLSVLIPTRRGDPLLVATHWPGNLEDLKQQANAPSSWAMTASTNLRKLCQGGRYGHWLSFNFSTFVLIIWLHKESVIRTQSNFKVHTYGQGVHRAGAWSTWQWPQCQCQIRTCGLKQKQITYFYL